jgi:hypothetical protein
MRVAQQGITSVVLAGHLMMSHRLPWPQLIQATLFDMRASMIQLMYPFQIQPLSGAINCLRKYSAADAACRSALPVMLLGTGHAGFPAHPTTVLLSSVPIRPHPWHEVYNLCLVALVQQQLQSASGKGRQSAAGCHLCLNLPRQRFQTCDAT